jgi:hypothetical protein
MVGAAVLAAAVVVTRNRRPGGRGEMTEAIIDATAKRQKE